MEAVDAADCTRLGELIRRVSPDFLNFHQRYFTPLILAVYCGRYNIVKQILDAGACVDFGNAFGITPLMEAARLDERDIMNLILEHNPDIHIKDKRPSHHWSALHFAAMSNRFESVQLLLEVGATLNDPTTPLCRSPMWTAALHNQHYILNFFLVQLRCKKQYIQLNLLFDVAVQKQCEASAIVVLQNGYCPSEGSVSEFFPFSTCFQFAAHYGMVELMSLMVELKPQFMQEDWLIRREFSDRLQLHPEFISSLVECRKQPRNLAKLCKSTILAQLGTYYIEKIKLLPLPTSLKKYLETHDSPLPSSQALGDNIEAEAMVC